MSVTLPYLNNVEIEKSTKLQMMHCTLEEDPSIFNTDMSISGREDSSLSGTWTENFIIKGKGEK